MGFCSTRIRKVLLVGLIFVLVLLPMLICLTSCNPIAADDIINNLLPNLWVFLANLIAAVILIVVMVWLVWKPTKNALQKRHDYIAQQIQEAEKAKESATISLNEANQLKVDALSQAMNITTEAKTEAFHIIEKAKLEAKLNSERIISETIADIAKRKQEIQQNAENNVINIAFDVANSILGKEIKKKDQDKYIDELLDVIKEDLKKSE